MEILQLKEVALLLGVSLFFAMGFDWLGYPYLLGYIATGVLIGPFVHFISSPMITMAGNFGALMLLFIVGLEFDLIKFKRIWRMMLVILCLQLLFNIMAAFLLGYIFALSLEYCILIGFLLTLSSTAVVVKLLEEMNELVTGNGTFVVSILIIQDLAFVPMMLILKGFAAQNTNIGLTMCNIAISIAISVAMIVILGKEENKLFSPLRKLFHGNQEIMTLASVAVCFGFAAVSSMLGISSAYGAFLGGLILGSFGNKLEIMQFALPIGSLLIMMFFVSIGTQIDLQYITKHFYNLALVSVLLIAIKILINYVIMRIMRICWQNSLFVAIMLSQCSEFTFALIPVMQNSGLISLADKNFLHSLTVISLTLGSIFPVMCHMWIEKFYRDGKNAN